MVEKVYNNFRKKEVRAKILEAWRGYKNSFGLECDLYYDTEGVRRADATVDSDIQALRQVRSEIRRQKDGGESTK
ncbi:hypothetical protein A2685_01225 [Candidatus Woesebacteria bacterium RIFCSPHIGHO2_01_FULL_37_10]|uniref:Uncharacterized protein n=1 Tax=Candidatus Woesebacteria bacterium RIFCSPHIGHO2_01_FULL_37_10 TaxID=1802489 RepID=A0A1F7XW38_9BACT|nr:MAG: hypothetical protein A2685_01225 [Candidatus Woesebacteria bacterium RIFCSPHIGHO2_01_FULL_37_10]